jgi:hypothetical protein
MPPWGCNREGEIAVPYVAVGKASKVAPAEPNPRRSRRYGDVEHGTSLTAIDSVAKTHVDEGPRLARMESEDPGMGCDRWMSRERRGCECRDQQVHLTSVSPSERADAWLRERSRMSLDYVESDGCSLVASRYQVTTFRPTARSRLVHLRPVRLGHFVCRRSCRKT